MKIMDRLSRVPRSREQATIEPESHILAPFEIRLIAEGKLEGLAKFAASSRLQAADPKGDTPLHLAARMGNLAVCDLFIRLGADPNALNHDRQSPADVAFSEGHGLAAQLLSSLVSGSPSTRFHLCSKMSSPGQMEFQSIVSQCLMRRSRPIGPTTSMNC